MPFLFLFISSIQANGLYLKPRTIIEKYPIKLSDVARLHKDIKDRVLFDSLEDIKILTIDELKDSINDPNISFYGKECLIIPLNKKYSKEEILESLEKEFFSKLGIQSTEAKIHYLGEEETFPSSGVELRWNNLPKRLTPGQKIFSLDFYVEREKIYSKKLKFLVETPLTALVASHDIARNAKLTKSDFMTKTFFSADAIADGFNHDITGYTAIVAIAEGSVIRKKQVREIHLVEKGMEVDIVFMKGSLFVRGKGVAKNSANEGELVKVVNSSSNHTVSGRAMDKGVVVIE
ncbi:MAG TPA: flagellar basal body P-ring formation chaperone FlgA [Leptospiraceae bacterium]|nr:flagellar basal body P-ring formation chaperone FlgA [Leptospiraceae bacterium]HNB97971.1 flagellar basal body P-ring formation chaperone FlgA [Leptospiraceae bacterium]HNE10764.1 flagellar basal body P-ring formation chaperone FlgA [Leptospiraceae bacterium]HNK59579.1 flagellar basal body P-ring formation chaperone FlgA [Leptospiraceae bacterium]